MSAPSEEEAMKNLQKLHRRMEEGFQKLPGRANQRMSEFFQSLEFYCKDYCEPVADVGSQWDNRRNQTQCSKQ